MIKIIVFTLSLAFLAVSQSKTVWAREPVVSSSANLKIYHSGDEDKVDFRVRRLKDFLSRYNSPLAPYAEDFVKSADTYNIDWRLVPAIAGVESTFGKHIPKGSYNAYGWANGNHKFTSWENSIEVVTSTLRQKYYDKGANTLSKISRRYAPPSTSWAWKVDYFMNKIDRIPVEFDL